MRNYKIVWYQSRRGNIVLNAGLGRRHYNRVTGITRNRAMRVTPKGRAYLAALALERDEFEEGKND